MLDRAIAAQILEIVEIEMPVVDLIAALAQEIADHVLARTFGAAGRGDRDEIARRRKLGIEAGIDGIQDFLLCIGVHCHCYPLMSRVERSKHILAGLVEGCVAFKITELSIQFAATLSLGDAG